MDSARIPYYGLMSGVQNVVAFKTRYRRDEADSEQWNKVVAEEFQEMLDRWKQFRWHTKAKEFEMLFEGWGPLKFDSPTDWRFSSVPARCIKVPQGSASCVDERLPYIAILRDYRIHELWEKISDETSATAAGWNVDAVKLAITRAGNAKTNSQNDWEYWQQRLKNADYCASFTESDIVRCATMLVKEYGRGGKKGRISEFMVTVDELDSEQKDKPGDMSGYLYSQPNQYAEYHEALIVCFQNTGDGTWASVRGIAIKSFKHIEVSNRLKCRAVDNAFLAAGPIVQPGTNTAKDQLQLAVLGPVTILAPGAEFIQHRLAADAAGILAVDRVLSNHLAQNIGHYNQRSISRDDGRGEQPTATAVELQASKETSLSQAQIDSYYDDEDTKYEQMWDRARKQPDEESRRMIANCLARGVPQEALDDMNVKANRLSGYPSPEMRKRNLNQIFGVIGSLPEDGKLNLLDELISVYLGPDKIKVFNPRTEKPDMDAAFATLENAAMEDGTMPLVISGMEHSTHLQIHLQYAAQKMQPLHDAMDEDGAIPPEELEEAYRYISILGPHCEEHLEPLRGDPARKQLAEVFKIQLANVVAFHGKLRGAILDARRQAQQDQLEQENATALGVMDQAKLESTKADIQRADIQAASDVRRKDYKTQESVRLSSWKAGQAHKISAAKAIGDLQIKKTVAKSNGNGSKKK